MPHLFRRSNHTEGASATSEGQHSSHHHHHNHHPHSIFSQDAFVRHHHQQHGSHTSTSPHGSSDPSESSARASANGSARRSAYPEALPSALSKRYTGPVAGTAVLDESVMPLEDAAVLFEMVTPESTPLLKSHVKERFETAIAEAVERRRQERQQQQQQQQSSFSGDSNAAESPSEPTVENNTSSFFKIDESVTGSTASASASHSHRRRHILNDGGYVLFTDSYLSAHPNSVVTGVTSELQLAGGSDISPFHHHIEGSDAEKQRLQEVKDYIREVEHEYRPLFRRRTSAMVYGRGQYMHTGSPDFSSNEVYYATPMDDTQAKGEPEIKKSSNKLRKVFSNPLF